MTSALHFMGKSNRENGAWEFEIEFEFAAAPPGFHLSVYFMGACRSRTLHSQRCDCAARACQEDPESRRDGATGDFTRFAGDVFALSPLEIRGETIDISPTGSWNPCFSALRCQFREYNMAIAVRPASPYRNWFLGNARP